MIQGLVNEWGVTFSSVADGTQPDATTGSGTSVTPAQNAYGSYAQLISGASVTADCYLLDICVSSVRVNGAARDCIVTIGMDPAGGTSYTDTITHLVCGPASLTVGGDWTVGGANFRFPLIVRAGTSIAAKASVNSATLTALRVGCVLRGKPTRPDMIWAGTKVTTFGASTGSSCGTSVTAGTAAEGSWTQMGSALTEVMRYWEFGFGVNSNAMVTARGHVDIGIGDATNKRVVIPNAQVWTTTEEATTKFHAGSYALGAVNDIVYARAQSDVALTGTSIAVYGVS